MGRLLSVMLALSFCALTGGVAPAHSQASRPVEANVESAKRTVPEPAPVSHNGVRYEVDFSGNSRGLGQVGGVLAAVEESSGNILWRLVVYPVVITPGEEEDAQEIFITDIAMSDDGAHLLVTNEARRRFSVDIATRLIAPAR